MSKAFDLLFNALVFLLIPNLIIANSYQVQFNNDNNDYFYDDPELDEPINMNDDTNQPGLKKYNAPALAKGAPISNNDMPNIADESTECEPDVTATTEPTATECESAASDNNTTSNATEAATSAANETTTAAVPQATTTDVLTMKNCAVGGIDQEVKARELRILVQHLYVAQARVQLEATEIKKAQAVANSAQMALEESANHVRAITAALHTAQQEVAAAAIRAQTAQLQLAAHDQLLFAARQDVDALSSQMVGLQAAEGISAPHVTFDITSLLEKLKQPLADAEKPTAVPPVITVMTAATHAPKKRAPVDDISGGLYYDQY